MTKKNLERTAIVVAILLAVVLFYSLNLGQYLTLDYLKESREYFAELYAGHRLAVITGYAVIYIIVTALSLPGAAVMTLAGGALFGLAIGTVVVSFASTIGATLACIVSRFLLRDWVQARFKKQLAAINKGIEKEGAFYLFTVRLIPVFPFFIINLVMGLTGMKIRTFYWISQLGMLPGTLVYVNAGKELARIEALKDIFSPSLIISFAILGLFPITTKKIMQFYRKKTGKKPEMADIPQAED